jgi:hypothetical protein
VAAAYIGLFGTASSVMSVVFDHFWLSFAEHPAGVGRILRCALTVIGIDLVLCSSPILAAKRACSRPVSHHPIRGNARHIGFAACVTGRVAAGVRSIFTSFVRTMTSTFLSGTMPT